jgi:hypothetical protein
LVLAVGGLGIGVFWRRMRRRGVIESGPDPAVELRAKLAESKMQTEPAAAEPLAEAVPEPAPTPSDPTSRRQAVHDQARGAIDELS